MIYGAVIGDDSTFFHNPNRTYGLNESPHGTVTLILPDAQNGAKKLLF